MAVSRDMGALLPWEVEVNGEVIAAFAWKREAVDFADMMLKKNIVYLQYRGIYQGPHTWDDEED